MMTLNKAWATYLVVFMCCLSALNGIADVGLTFELHQKRNRLLQQKNRDSVWINEVVQTDTRLIESQQESINRIAAHQKNLERIHPLMAAICIGLTLMVALSLFVASMLNDRLNKATNQQRTLRTACKELLLSMLFTLLPSKETLQRKAGVHFLVFICLIAMFISLLSYFLRIV